MGKVHEIFLVSARGAQTNVVLWKLQWFAVGWNNPDNKYCTKIDASGNVNPVWKTKFSTTIDDPSELKIQDLALHVEVYSREPIFLRESLLGSASIVLKEFLEKLNPGSDIPKPVEEVGSFQLRKKNSSKPLGFVDVSIRVSEEKDDPYLGADEGFNLVEKNGGINLATSGSFRPHPPQNPSQQPDSSHLMPFPPPPGRWIHQLSRHHHHHHLLCLM